LRERGATAKTKHEHEKRNFAHEDIVLNEVESVVQLDA
jgi:hypothetical protein